MCILLSLLSFLQILSIELEKTIKINLIMNLLCWGVRRFTQLPHCCNQIIRVSHFHASWPDEA